MSNNLDFLNEFIDENYDKYQNPPFLKSSFNDDIWIIEYNDKKQSIINFNIVMSDKTLLTSKANLQNLNTLKYWLLHSIYQNDSQMSSKSTMRNKIFTVLTLFDIFNINDQHLDICKNGFETITNDFLKHILNDLASNSNKFNGAYNLSNRFYNYYKNNVKKINVSFDKNSTLKDLTSDEIDEFIDYLNKNDNFRAEYLYPDTILKPNTYPEEIKDAQYSRKTREFNSYFRNNKNNFLSEGTFLSYKRAILALKDLKNIKSKHKLKLPDINAFYNIENFKPTTNSENRFETFPSKFVFEAFKKAIEFHYQYGEDIVSSYINFAKKMKTTGNNKKNFIYTKEIENIFKISLTQNLKNSGVVEFKSYISSDNKYQLMRKNYYFYDLLKIYYGAVQFVIGALMARRQSEMTSLISGECLDEINNVLLFKRSKSSKGLFGTKDTLALPLDPLGIQMIKNLERIHNVIGGQHSLFSMPNFKNPMIIKDKPDNTTYGENLDAFFDYIEAPMKNGKRLYIRQHQLRRFFAMSFFWSSGFGSMDTLRWFMGHTDVQHLYHYITENVSGAVLKNIKAQYVAENGSVYKEDLANLIKERYNTDDYSLIETEDLTYYIEELLEDEQIEIEPEFLNDDEGNKYKIIVKVRNKGDKDDE